MDHFQQKPGPSSESGLVSGEDYVGPYPGRPAQVVTATLVSSLNSANGQAGEVPGTGLGKVSQLPDPGPASVCKGGVLSDL